MDPDQCRSAKWLDVGYADLHKKDLPEPSRRELHDRRRSLQRDRAQAQDFLVGLESVAR